MGRCNPKSYVAHGTKNSVKCPFVNHLALEGLRLIESYTALDSENIVGNIVGKVYSSPLMDPKKLYFQISVRYYLISGLRSLFPALQKRLRST